MIMQNYNRTFKGKSFNQIITEEQILTKARTFNGLIKTLDDLWEHIERLQKCTTCKIEFYDKLCPRCVAKNMNLERERTAKEILTVLQNRNEFCCRFCVEGEKNSYGKYECDIETELRNKFLKDKEEK